MGERTDNLYYGWSESDFVWGSSTRSGLDKAVIRLSGYLKMPGISGTVLFRNHDDDGSRTIIDGSIIIENWNSQNGLGFQDNSTMLNGGETYYFERLHNNTGGPAHLRQYWQHGNMTEPTIMSGQDFYHFKN